MEKMSSVNPRPGSIPSRWLNCPRNSEANIAKKFIAFKTPLDAAFTEQMPTECIFLPDMIFGYCKALKLSLGLWIDLTNTNRFYDRSVVESRGVQYVKLQCKGHGETPSPEQTRSFIEIVDNFISEQPFKIIGVHCTHGFNTTGFLIASYLVERLDFSIEAAVGTFARNRPPGIYKQDYINELFRRYGNEDVAPPAPEMPSWCVEFDDSDRGHGHGHRKRHHDEVAHLSNSQQAMAVRSRGQQQHSNGNLDGDDQPVNETEDGNVEEGKPKNKKRRREVFTKNARFMAGVPGVAWISDQPRVGDIQQKVQDMCGWKKTGFPGCRPVSMDCQNIRRLHEIPYRVSWNADGTRYMMLIDKRDEIYFLDRNNSVFQVENLTFLKNKHLNEHLENTLLDGEMVLDKYQGKSIPRYLIYDIVKINNSDIGRKPFYPERLQCIDMEIINPRLEAIKLGIIHRPSEPFSVRKKDFWDIRQSNSLLGEKFARTLLHEPDGLIFQPSEQPYTGGIYQDVLKWKPLNMNSVDFRLKVHEESGEGIVKRKICLLFVGGCDAPFTQMKYTKSIRDLNLDNKIVECTVSAQGHWEFMRERTDKRLPNSYNTAVSVIESIRNPVTKDILLSFIDRQGYRNEHEITPPPINNNSHPQHQQIQQPQQQQHHEHQQQRHQEHQQHRHQEHQQQEHQ